MFRKVTPVLVVERIEPCLDFWTKLGFQKTVEVPEQDHLGFVILAKDDVEIMYQSRSSAEHDVPSLKGFYEGGHSICLYIEVEDLDAVLPNLEGAEVAVEKRTTFYGATEIYVKEPSGQLVGFAART